MSGAAPLQTGAWPAPTGIEECEEQTCPPCSLGLDNPGVSEFLNPDEWQLGLDLFSGPLTSHPPNS